MILVTAVCFFLKKKHFLFCKVCYPDVSYCRSAWIKKGDSYLQSHLPNLSKAGVETLKQEYFGFHKKGSSRTFSAFAVNWTPGLEFQAFELATQHQTSQDTILYWL